MSPRPATGGARARRSTRPSSDEREQAILNTAETLLEDRGLADISVDDDGMVGTVSIGSTDLGAVAEAERQIRLILNPPSAEVGATYPGRVVNITKFGAFVNILPGRDGLVHISKLGGGKRIDSVESVLSLGDEIEVRVEDIDPNGKISLRPTASDSADGGSDPKAEAAAAASDDGAAEVTSGSDSSSNGSAASDEERPVLVGKRDTAVRLTGPATDRLMHRQRAAVDAMSNGHPVTRVDGGHEPVWRIAPEHSRALAELAGREEPLVVPADPRPQPLVARWDPCLLDLLRCHPCCNSR